MISVTEKSIPVTETGCWLWTGTVRGDYGVIYINNKSDRISAHRQSWIEHNGVIPDGMWVLHKCDVPLCVNPNHLYLGNREQNTRDVVQRKRLCGIRNPRNKLSEKDVQQIRERLANGETGYSIAKDFGVKDASIYRIASGKNWKKT